MLDRIAHVTWHRPKLVLCLVGVFVLLAGALGYDVEGRLTPAGFTDSASESERATALLRDELGYDANPGVVLLVRPRGGGRLDVARPAVRREVDRIAGRLARTRHVGNVINPLADAQAGRALIAADGRSLIIAGQLSTDDIESDGGDAVQEARNRIGTSTLDVGFGGFAASFDEVNDLTRSDLARAEMIAFPILALLMLLVFRGVVAASIPLLVGVISILGTFLVLRIMAGLVDTSLYALNIATALSLGLAVDYALLLVSRFREELDRDGATPHVAHRRTVLTAGRTVLFSGFTVAVALAALVLLPQRFLYSLGISGAAVALLSAVIAVLVVPALLSLLGPRINALSIRRGPAVSDRSDGWYRLAHGVMRRPVVVALACTALLLAAAAPALSTVLTGPSAEAVPPDQPSAAVNNYIDETYARGVTQAITVTVSGDADAAALAQLGRRIIAIDGITAGTPFARASDDVAFANFTPAQPALRRRIQDAVDTIRTQRVGDGAAILVSGNTARFMDEKQSLRERLPLVAAIIATTTVFLLFLLTGSVILPLKALLMNALTLAASLGVVVLAFQHGWLDGLFGYTGPAAIEVTTLVFMFAVTFGLATDYAVLVMARIKEQHDLGVGNEEAVAVGIARTGRVITAAAVMIAVVFLAFATSSVFFMKQLAVGEAVAVLVDATIVRALLVPALMRLFGEWNWWAPRPLARLQRRFGFSEVS